MGLPMDEDAIVAEAVSALVHGPGYYVVPNALNHAQIEELNAIINDHTKDDDKVSATHFHGSEYNQNKLHLQKRVWNLLNIGAIFSELVQHPIVMKVFAQILGKNFILGSFAANKLLPGAPGQEPHVDYPYWDMHEPEEFPMGINSSFHLNCQSLFTLQDFTLENGATAVVPHSQKRGTYPDAGLFKEECVQVECPAGSLVLFTGMLWHCAMPNNSRAIRTSLLGQYLPKFVKPMEDLIDSVNPQVIAQGTPQLRQLIGVDLRYPERLHQSQTGNSEGRCAKPGGDSGAPQPALSCQESKH